MTAFVLGEEFEGGGIQFRLLVPADGDGGERFLVARSVSEPELWLVVAHGGEQVIRETIEVMVEPGSRAVQIVDTGCALCGLRFEELLAGPMAVAQHKVWSMLPDAMQDVDPEVVWATRRFALGEALTRVPRALHAVAGAWLPEGPVAVTDLRGRWW